MTSTYVTSTIEIVWLVLSYRYDYTREELSMVPRLALVILKTVRRISAKQRLM